MRNYKARFGFSAFLVVSLWSCSSGPKNPQLTQVGLLSGHTRSQHEAVAQKFMISTQGSASTQAGVKMFEMGGNAFDAFAAISFAISVERPQSTGIGGGGFLTYYSPQMQKPATVDFREMAPARAHSKIFLNEDGEEVPKKSIDGIFSAGIPGTVAGVIEIHKKFGKLPLEQVLQPAIELAEKGFRVYPHLAQALQARAPVLKKYRASLPIFFKKKGAGEWVPLDLGDLVVQKDLAKTLQEIAKKGRAGFYSGWVAQAIVRQSNRLGGLISAKDLANYKVKFRPAVEGKYGDYEIYSMGPPSSGGAHIVQILNMLEGDNLSQYGAMSSKSIHLVSSAMQLAFADRAKYLGDADFVSVPLKGLISKPYAKELRKKISLNQAIQSQKVEPGNPLPYESDETTHFTIMDHQGNTISSTQTINYWFGSGVVVEGTGVILNDEMDDFATKPGASNLFGAVGGRNNLVEPGKRPLSSMSPTIVFKDQKPLLALGTPSGTRILTCVAQTILNYIEFKMPLYESVAAHRFHHQWQPDAIRFDQGGLTAQVKRELEGMGHQLMEKDLGCKIQAIAREKLDEQWVLRGVSDPRGEGMSTGM